MARRDGRRTSPNHRRIVPLYHVGIFGILAINLIWRLVQLVRWTSWQALLELLVAAALLGLFFYARIFALTVQDRIIRLEMRLRLKEILPPDLKGRIDELTPRPVRRAAVRERRGDAGPDARGPDQRHQEPRRDQAPRSRTGRPTTCAASGARACAVC